MTPCPQVIRYVQICVWAKYSHILAIQYTTWWCCDCGIVLLRGSSSISASNPSPANMCCTFLLNVASIEDLSFCSPNAKESTMGLTQIVVKFCWVSMFRCKASSLTFSEILQTEADVLGVMWVMPWYAVPRECPTCFQTCWRRSIVAEISPSRSQVA